MDKYSNLLIVQEEISYLILIQPWQLPFESKMWFLLNQLTSRPHDFKPSILSLLRKVKNKN